MAELALARWTTTRRTTCAQITGEPEFTGVLAERLPCLGCADLHAERGADLTLGGTLPTIYVWLAGVGAVHRANIQITFS